MDRGDHCLLLVFFKQKTAYEMRISDWSSDVCSSDLSYPRCLDVAIGVVRTKFIALANLRDVPVLDQRRAVPDCQEGFAPSGGEREINAGCRNQPSFCIQVPRMEEIAVAIDVHEPQPSVRAGAGGTAKNHAAVSPTNKTR